MKCLKCEGTMVLDIVFVGTDNVMLPIHRCLNCGDIVDEVILKNRAHRPIIRKRRRGKHGDQKHNRK